METTPSENVGTLWPRTDWSGLREAAEAAGKEAKPLEELYRKYQTPLRVHLHCHFRTFPIVINNADDLLQAFAEKKILKVGWLGKADPQRRFRDFLRSSLTNFVWDWLRKQRPMDELPPDLGDRPNEEEEEAFPFSCAQAILAETLDRVERTSKDPMRDQPRSGQVWEVLRMRVLDPIFRGCKPVPYKTLVRDLKLRSPTEATNMLVTGKRLFRRCLEQVISEDPGSNTPKTELRLLTESIEWISKKKAKNK